MKKILMLFAAAALVLGAASCQKENFSQEVTPGEEKIDYSDDPMGVIKVYIKKDDTKMAFEEKNNALYRSWEEKDVIDGCTKVGEVYKSFAYSVSEVGEEEGEGGEKKPYIVLSKSSGETGIPAADTKEPLHFVYAPGAVTFDSEGACSLDLSQQDEAHIPAVMVASGEIGEKEGKPYLKLDFTNIAAVLAIKSPSLKDFDGITPMTGTFSKVSVSALTIGKLTLGSDGYVTSDDDKYTPNWNGAVEPGTATVTSKDANFGADVYVAVLPGAYPDITAKIIDAKDGESKKMGNFGYAAAHKDDRSVSANAYLRIQEKGFTRIPVAKISENKYAYISDAFAAAVAAQGDVEITMMENAETYETIEFTKSNGKITLDLGSCNIVCKGDKALYAHSDFEIVADKDNPGTISANAIAVHMHPSGEVATLDIKGGNFVGGGYYTSADNGGVVYSATNSDGNLTATLNISGGHITATNNEKKSRAVNASGLINISGGKIEASESGYAFRAYRNFTATISGNAEFIAKKYSPVYPYPDKDGNKGTLNVTGGYLYSEGSEAPVKTGQKHDNAELSINITGGYFNKEVTPASGYKCTDELSDDEKTYKDKTYTHKVVETYEAKIGTKEYRTLAEAIQAANESETDCTITLLSDLFGLTEPLEFDSKNEQKITFDFNDYKLSTSGNGYIKPAANCKLTLTDSGEEKIGGITNTSSYSVYSVAEAVEICIDGGKYIGANQYGSIRFYGKNAKMTISGGSTYVLNNRNTEGHAINVGGTASTTAFLTIKGGTFESITASALRNRYGEVKIEGGFFIGVTNAVYAASTRPTSITGGYFHNGDSESPVIGGSSLNGSVKGGYYNKAVEDGYCVSGYKSSLLEPSIIVNEKEYGYIVKKDESAPDVIKVNETGYKTLAAAIDAANNSISKCDFQLLTDVISDRDTIDFTAQNLTLDLNGKTLTGRLKISGSCEIVGEGTLKVPNNNDGFLIKVLQDASLTIQSGTFAGTTASASNKYCILAYGASSHRAKVTINGGTISAQTEMGTIRAYYADVVINAGTVKATSKFPRTFVSAKYGYFTINDGRFEGSNAIWRCSATSGKMTINGGIFIAQHYSEEERNGIFYLSSTANTLEITGGAFWSSTGIVGVDDSKVANVTNLTVTGGKFFKDASISLPASSNYKWTSIPADETTIQGKSLTYQVVKTN